MPTFSRSWLMKIAVVPELLRAPVILRSAWLIRRACRPTWLSPISPSISARGTRAATESMTITSSAPERMSMSAISSACSPVSGWLTSRASVSTPSFLAYSGSRACSASMNAAIPPARWAFATACRATVVLPEDSGPKTSTTRPRGRPPMPSATSRAIDPVGITSIGGRLSSPRRITDPLPNWRSICARAVSSAFSRSAGAGMSSPLERALAERRADAVVGGVVAGDPATRALVITDDARGPHRQSRWSRLDLWTTGLGPDAVDDTSPNRGSTCRRHAGPTRAPRGVRTSGRPGGRATRAWSPYRPAWRARGPPATWPGSAAPARRPSARSAPRTAGDGPRRRCSARSSGRARWACHSSPTRRGRRSGRARSWILLGQAGGGPSVGGGRRPPRGVVGVQQGCKAAQQRGAVGGRHRGEGAAEKLGRQHLAVALQVVEALRGQPDHGPAPVAGVGLALEQAPRLQVRDDVADDGLRAVQVPGRLGDRQRPGVGQVEQGGAGRSGQGGPALVAAVEPRVGLVGHAAEDGR